MGITFTRRGVRDTDYDYELLAESGTVIRPAAPSSPSAGRFHRSI